MEAIQARVQEAITNMITSLDKDHIRKLQANMHRCSAACCENPHYTMDDVQSCIEKCSQPIQVAQNFIGQELQTYQDRLQRCAMDCSDKIRDKLGPKSSDAEVSRYRSEMESCVVTCGDKHIALVPAMMKRVKEVLEQQQQQQKKH